MTEEQIKRLNKLYKSEAITRYIMKNLGDSEIIDRLGLHSIKAEEIYRKENIYGERETIWLIRLCVEKEIVQIALEDNITVKADHNNDYIYVSVYIEKEIPHILYQTCISKELWKNDRFEYECNKLIKNIVSNVEKYMRKGKKSNVRY